MSFESFPQKRAHVLYSTLPHFLHVTVRASCRSFIHICHSPPRSGLRGPRWSLVESWQGKQGTAHQPLRLGSSPRRWPRAFESQTCQSSWRRVDTVRGWRRGRPPPFLSPPAVAGTHSRTLTLSLFPSSSAAAACLCRSLVAVFVPLCCGWRRRFCPGRRGSTTRRGRGSAAGCLARPVRPAPGEEPPGWPTFPLGVVLEEWTGGPFDCWRRSLATSAAPLTPLAADSSRRWRTVSGIASRVSPAYRLR
jgi:hypothetical protein